MDAAIAASEDEGSWGAEGADGAGCSGVGAEGETESEATRRVAEERRGRKLGIEKSGGGSWSVIDGDWSETYAVEGGSWGIG
jgi:hypothetical protein